MTLLHTLRGYHQRGAAAILLMVVLSTLAIEGASIRIIIQVREGSAILLVVRLRGALGIVPPSVIVSEVMIVCDLE